MTQFIFSVYDSAAEAFLPPFFVPAIALAIRTFKQTANTPEHHFNQHPSDFTLFELGTFDQSTGAITTHATPTSHGLAITHIEA